MTIPSLKIIGERLNYSIPGTKKSMDLAYKTRNFDEIKRIAQEQEKNGAFCLDVNVGLLPDEMMSLTTEAVQEAVNIPLCFDSDNISKLEAGLEAYDCKNGIPILNSATESRMNEVLSLRKKRNFRIVLMVSERIENGTLMPNLSCSDSYQTAKRLYLTALSNGFQPNQMYIDPGVPPIGADENGLVNIALDTIGKINSEIKGVHTLAGITNLTFGLPPKLKMPLQNAFLTLAVRNGLDTIIGSPEKEYEILGDENPYLLAFQKVLASKNKIETFVSEVYPLMK